MKKNATDAERVRRLAMRARLAWLTERRSSFAMTTVTAWATASRHVRPARSHLWREKQRRMTKQPFSRTRKSYKITIPAPAVAGTDQTCSDKCTVFRRRETPDRGRLHRLRLRKLPRRFYQRQDRPGRLSEAGCRRLQ